MRMEFDLPMRPGAAGAIRARASQRAVGEPFGMDWQMWDAADAPKRVAVLVSRYDHCLLDLLWR